MGRDSLSGPVSCVAWKLSRALLDEVRVRVREAASWCLYQQYPDDPAKKLRSSELEPPNLTEMRSHREDTALLQRCVEHVVSTRSRLLDERKVEIISLDSALQSGLILGHDTAYCTADELSYTFSPIFDRQDNIGWDSWVHFLPLDSTGRKDHFTFAWIPERLVSEVDEAMFSTTDCIAWIRPENLPLV